MKPEDKIAIEEAEAVAFQKNMVQKIHIVGARGKRQLTVNVQPAERTMAILNENGISPRQSWSEDPQKLANLLGVDAVVKCRATK